MHDNTIAFLEATIIFLLLTNAISVLAAAWAVWKMTRTSPPSRRHRVLFAEVVVSMGLAFAIANAIGGIAGKPHPAEIHAAGFVRSAQP